jgi:hypothetical protein
MLGILTHPAFDHGIDELRGGEDVDATVGAAYWLDRVGELDAESIVGQPNYAATADRVFKLPARRAIIVPALQRRPKNSTSTPLKSC